MELPTADDLIAAIDAFLKRHNMAPTTFGSLSTGDTNLVSALRGGASPRLNRLHRIRDFMAAKDLEAGFVHADDTAAESASASSGKSDDITAPAPAPVGADA